MSKYIKSTLLLAIAGVALSAQSAKAVSYTPDDLLLTVYQTGNNTEYTIDLGQASLYMTGGADATASNGSAINLGNYGSDLSTIFGSYSGSSTTFWSIVGTSGATGNTTTGKTTQGEYIDTVFVSNAESTPGTQTSAWSRASKNTQGNSVSTITTYASTIASSTATGSTGAVTLATSNPSSYDTIISGNGSKIGYTSSGGFAVEDSFSQGTGLGGATLDLYRLTATTNVAQPPTTVIPTAGEIYVGSFNFSSTGELQFSTNADSFAAIPEPSSYALMGLGSLLLMVWFRRRSRNTVLA